jgi:hypothetical protein
MDQTANIEALLNIMANGIEIMGVAGGFPALLLCFIPFAAGLRGYTSKIAIASVCMIIIGLAFPGVVNLMVSSSGDSHTGFGVIIALIISGVVGLGMLAASIGIYFLPTIIAYREGRPQRTAMTICNLLGFIPLAWLGAYIWACLPVKTPPPLEKLN